MKEAKSQLNKEQFEAVNHKEGPLLIVAGAGTGKTKVITERIANIIKEGWARSDEILALTFTEKAAGEMEERVDNLLPLGYFDLWISTFHSFGEKILRESGLDIGIPADFKLLDEFEQYSLFKKNLDKFNLDYYQPLGNPTKFIRSLLKHFSRLKDEDIPPEEYLKYTEELKQNLDNCLSGGRGAKKALDLFKNTEGEFDKEIASYEVKRLNEVANAYHVYQNLLLENNALDFGDLINYCLKLFRERPNALEKYRRKFKYILLDEFQDTNWAQYELIKILASPKNNLVAVADDDQAIFRFRGASMSNILQFKKDYPESKEIFLKENYRNSQNILDLSYNFITLNNPNRLEYQLGKEGLDKKLKANTSDQGKIEVIGAVDSVSEIAQVVNKIAELKASDKEATWDDFAILTRTNEQAKEATSFLDEARFPYILYSSRGLYVKEPIMNVISYLRATVDFYNNNAMFKILSLPVFGFATLALVNLNYLAQKKAWSIYRVLKNASLLQINSGEAEKINKFLAIFEKHVALARDKNVSEVVLAFVNDTGYLKHLIKDEEIKVREATNFLQQFMKRIKAFEQDAEDKTAKNFLEELDMEIEAGEQGNLPMDIDAGPEAIKIMTIHSAKGLEFKYVFITNMVDKRFPTVEKREAIKIPDPLVKEILPEGDYHLEEERRLFYVAITRSKRGIYFSHARDCGGKRKKRVSRFLIEAKLAKDLSIDDDECKREEKQADLLKKKPEAKKSLPDEIPLPKTFSYTQLAAFENCPYQYRFAHILKIPIRGKPAFSFGKTMHSALQKIFNAVMQKAGFNQNDLFSQNIKTKNNKKDANIKITLDECLKIYEESWIDDWYPSEKLKEEYRKKGKKIIKDFYELYKDDWPNTILLEKGFNTKINVEGENFSVRGKIDRIDREDGKIKIVDYKTGSTKEKLRFSDKEQLLIYQLACQELFKEEILSLTFYYLDNLSEVSFLGDEKDLTRIKEKIVENIRSIKKGEFPPKPSELCKYCDFANICEHRKI